MSRNFQIHAVGQNCDMLWSLCAKAPGLSSSSGWRKTSIEKGIPACCIHAIRVCAFLA
jgi:hypothetical protein